MATDGPTPQPCDQDIFNNGEAVCVIAGVSSNRMETFIQSVAVSTGERVDWHFAGGRAVVKVLGDATKVRESILARAPDVTRLQIETGGGEDYATPIHWL
jgi:hypothetical protein